RVRSSQVGWQPASASSPPRAPTAASPTSTSAPAALRSAEPLAVRRTPAAVASPDPMRGKRTCVGRPAPSTGRGRCRWRRAFRLATRPSYTVRALSSRALFLLPLLLALLLVGLVSACAADDPAQPEPLP